MNTCIYHFQQIVSFCSQCKLNCCQYCLSEHKQHNFSIITYSSIKKSLQPLLNQINCLPNVQSQINQVKQTKQQCQNRFSQMIDGADKNFKKTFQSFKKQVIQIQHLENVLFAINNNNISKLKRQDFELLKHLINSNNNLIVQQYNEKINTVVKTLNKNKQQYRNIFTTFNNNNPILKYEKGDEYFKNQEYSQALDVYNIGIHQIMKKLKKNNVDIVRSFENHIEVCKRTKNTEQLIELLENMCLIDFQNIIPYREELANIYTSKNMDVQAIYCFRDIIRRQGATAYTLTCQANCFINLGLHKNALKLYQQAVRLEPQTPEPYYNQGIVYNILGDKKKAEVFFNQARILRDMNPRTQFKQSCINFQQFSKSFQPILPSSYLKKSDYRQRSSSLFQKSYLTVNQSKININSSSIPVQTNINRFSNIDKMFSPNQQFLNKQQGIVQSIVKQITHDPQLLFQSKHFDSKRQFQPLFKRNQI